MRALLICFGLLDLYAFFISPYISSNPPKWLGNTVLFSLLATGLLTIVGNKYGYIIYYFQLPLRLAFQIGLTFGFFLLYFPSQPGTFTHGMTMASIFAAEAIRLMTTIQVHRK